MFIGEDDGGSGKRPCSWPWRRSSAERHSWLTARRLRPSGKLPSLDGWALADRALGSGWTWLLLGGTVFTAYAFLAVPGLVYGSAAVGFFALPYTIIVCPLAFVLLPRLWSVAHTHGYVTVADFVRGRYGSSALASAVALTGILATIPYLALQLLSIRAVLALGGLHRRGLGGDLLLIGLFTLLAAATHRCGMRAPAVVSVLKGLAVFCSALVTVALVLGRLGGPGQMFESASRSLVRHEAGGATLTLAPHQQGAFLTLTLGSALALLMYPHVLTVGLAASGRESLRRASVGLLAWTGVLGLFALTGVAALAAGVGTPAGHAESAVPLLVDRMLPALLAGLVLGAVTVAALVPAAVMSIAIASLVARNIYLEYFQPTATPKRQVRIAQAVSLLATTVAVGLVLGLRDQAAINLQLLGGLWILQTLPAVMCGLFTRWLHQRALLAGWGAGMVVGTAMVATQGFVSVIPVPLGPHALEVYSGLAALLLNFAIAVVLTTVYDRLGTPRGTDTTLLPQRLIARQHPKRGTSSS